jgi:signal transduction histidine kinase
MKRWSFKVKVGVYAALLTMAALVVGTSVMLVTLYFHQIAELDEEMAEDAAELVWDLSKFRDAPTNPLDELKQDYIPLPLREDYLIVVGPGGRVVYRSENLREVMLEPVLGKPHTQRIHGKLCRVGVWREGPYLVRIGVRVDMIQRFMKNLGLGFLSALPAVGIVVFFGGVWLARRTTAPLAQLSDSAERIDAANPDERLPVPETRDEIAKLTEVLNRSFDRFRGSYQAAARFSADASHQLKTPLTILRAGLDHLSRASDLTDSQSAEIAVLRHQTRRLTSLIDDLLLLAQADAGRVAPELAWFDLSELVSSAVDDLEVLCSDKDIRQEVIISGGLFVQGDRRLLAMVLQNLMENATKYVMFSGIIRVQAGLDERGVYIKVGNTANEIAAEERLQIFERFRRGAAVGGNVSGHGLGLNIARELVRVHHGELKLVDAPGDWVEFEVRLPLAAEGASVG